MSPNVMIECGRSCRPTRPEPRGLDARGQNVNKYRYVGRHFMKTLFLVLALFAAATMPAAAQTKLTGSFTATKACPALQSIKKTTNPGDVKTAVGTAYKLIGGNKEPATYYWIVVPDASPDFRWVAVDCGTADITASAPASSTK